MGSCVAAMLAGTVAVKLSRYEILDTLILSHLSRKSALVRWTPSVLLE